MKQTLSRNIAWLTLFAAVLALCLAAGPANAQSAFQGNFNLPHATRWGEAVLPPGDYRLSIRTTATPAMVVIQDAKSFRTVAYEPINIREDSTAGESALLIGSRGAERVVHSLRVAELGVVFVSDPALAHPKRVREEARNAETIPVQVAQK